MGMGSPDNRRKADGSYQTQGVGRGFFCSQRARKGRMMAELPPPLAIAISFVAAMWTVGAAAYYFDYPAELVWLTLLIGLGAALTEWRLHKNSDPSHD